MNQTVIITCTLLSLCVPNDSLGLLSDADKGLVKVIAESNRANIEVLHSFDCRYNWRMENKNKTSGQLEITCDKEGRWSFQGEKISCRELFKKQQYRSDFVYNTHGKKMREYTDERGTLILSRNADPQLIPGTQLPWYQIDGGISTRLDSLKETDGEIVSLKRFTKEENEYITLTLKRLLKLPDGLIQTFLVDLIYSVKEGYLPIQFVARFHDPVSGNEMVHEGKITSIKTMSCNGNTIFIPTDFEEQQYLNGEIVTKYKYTVDPESISLNPDLPEDLFDIIPNPNDRIFDFDLQLVIKGHEGTSLDAISSQIKEYKNIFEEVDVKLLANHGKTDQITIDGIVINLVYIPSGSYQMGSPDNEIGYPDVLLKRFPKGKPTRPIEEGPVRTVTVEKGFYLSVYEITVEQFSVFNKDYKREPVDGISVSEGKFPALVSWTQAKEFCDWLSAKTGKKVRLPYEKEWEYACRAGTSTRFFWGDSEKDIYKFANVADTNYQRICPNCAYIYEVDDGHASLAEVGQYQPNAFGLYDLIGNAPEWCLDIDISVSEKDGSKIERHPVKGGGWRDDIIKTRCASRTFVDSSVPAPLVGFRILIEE